MAKAKGSIGSVKEFLSSMNKKFKSKYGADVLYKGDEAGNFLPFPTGYPTFDWLNSGIGGFPRGGMTLVHGLESTGKSTFVLSAIDYAMRVDPDIQALYIDVENSLTEDFLTFRGIDASRFSLTGLNTEDALIVAEEAIKANVYDIIVIDSLAKMESDKMLEKDLGDSGQRNRRAYIITEFFRRITFILRQSHTALVCINQEIDNQNKKTPYDPPTVLPCGRQQLFSANLRIELKRSKVIKVNDVKVGYQTSFTTAKNKVANREKTLTHMHYIYERGFLREYSLLDYLERIGYIKKETVGRYSFVKKEIYGELFKPPQMLGIVETIRDELGLDLYAIRPDDDVQFDTNDSYTDVGTLGEAKDGVSGLAKQEPEDTENMELD